MAQRDLGAQARHTNGVHASAFAKGYGRTRCHVKRLPAVLCGTGLCLGKGKVQVGRLDSFQYFPMPTFGWANALQIPLGFQHLNVFVRRVPADF
jgi:hypothetical protein